MFCLIKLYLRNRHKWRPFSQAFSSCYVLHWDFIQMSHLAFNNDARNFLCTFRFVSGSKLTTLIGEIKRSFRIVVEPLALTEGTLSPKCLNLRFIVKAPSRIFSYKNVFFHVTFTQLPYVMKQIQPLHDFYVII